MKNTLQGTGVALVTPFDKNKAVDYPALARLVDYVIAGGADYLVALGTTAETPTLTNEEKKAVAGFIKEKTARRVPLVLGIGGNNTREVINQINEYDLQGTDAVLSVTPYYNKPSQEGIYEHYKAIAEASPKPIILYNVPARTGVNMTAETTLRLAKEKNIVATKEASGSIPQISYILRDKPEDFAVLSGDDNMALPLIALGGDGVISVAANAYPERVTEMVNNCLRGDFKKASEIQLQMLECVENLFCEGNPVGIKAALALKGLMENELRLPLIACSDNLCEKLKELTEKYSL